jgi:predicted phosphodiesterase
MNFFLTYSRAEFRVLISAVIIIALAALSGCNYEYSPHETDVSSSFKNLNRKNLDRLSAEDPSGAVRIAVMSDTHYDYGNLADAVSVINGMDDISFIVVTGDVTSKGMLREFEQTADILGGLHRPSIVVIGNHDCLSNGREIYRKMYNSENFTFTYAGIRFSALNLNLWECDISDISFIENYIDGSEPVKVVFTHIPPFDCDVFSENQKALFGTLLDRHGVDLSVQGHNHYYGYTENIRGYGFDSLLINSIGNREFSLIEVHENEISIQKISY